MIQLKNLTKYYAGYKALDNVSLDIHEGSIYGIIGASGAGKSTLIRCINLLETPDSGKIIIQNQDVTQFTGNKLREHRRKTGMIFQHFNLLSCRTVYENIALPLTLSNLPKPQIKEKVMELVQLAGLTDKVKHYPSQLSGGQKQRVAIARALINQPDILLCDEATSALDPNTTRSVLTFLKDINRRFGITILLITHEMEVVRTICDTVAVMADGAIIEENSVEQIFLNPQKKLTQTLVHSVTHERQPARKTVNDSSEGYPVIRLAFMGKQAQAPVITTTAKKFAVDFSILHGDIETINDKSMGFLMTKVIGSEEKIEQAIAFLREQHITVEVVGYEQ
ncbi:MAG: methionine ABC transporter ATP-binding protein [Endozoicomonadaceae bacterium]|nr:methionine ABC transporter ATP-binding protein [Endozoicomonadaceae bacterium]MCY4330876.1 methionine ABC transporter ATP-binding protein [Endozoicomonadaceae bacterium]